MPKLREFIVDNVVAAASGKWPRATRGTATAKRLLARRADVDPLPEVGTDLGDAGVSGARELVRGSPDQ